MKLFSFCFLLPLIFSCSHKASPLPNKKMRRTLLPIETPTEKKDFSSPITKFLHTAPPDTAKYGVGCFHRKKLEGDFNGDGKTEILYESLMSRKTGKQIDSIVFKNYYKGEYWPYENQGDKLIELEPILKLKCPDGINELKFHDEYWHAFGILQMINLGDINENLEDEIALIVNWADWTAVNTCQIYSYCNEKWQDVFWFEIHEAGLEYHSRKSNEITNAIECKNGQWYYLVEDETTFDYKWKKLNPCNCNTR